MITIYFNETGYYVIGGGIEIAQSCPPALTESGSPVFHPLHHTYWMLFRALKDVQGKKTQEDVMVYNDSRIIEEMNGIAEPFDETCGRWQKAIRRNVLPAIRACVLFRKKPSGFIGERVVEGQKTLLSPLSLAERERLAQKYIGQLEIRIKRQRATRAQRFREGHRSEAMKEKWYGNRQK